MWVGRSDEFQASPGLWSVASPGKRSGCPQKSKSGSPIAFRTLRDFPGSAAKCNRPCHGHYMKITCPLRTISSMLILRDEPADVTASAEGGKDGIADAALQRVFGKTPVALHVSDLWFDGAVQPEKPRHDGVARLGAVKESVSSMFTLTKICGMASVLKRLILATPSMVSSDQGPRPRNPHSGWWCQTSRRQIRDRTCAPASRMTLISAKTMVLPGAGARLRWWPFT